MVSQTALATVATAARYARTGTSPSCRGIPGPTPVEHISQVVAVGVPGGDAAPLFEETEGSLHSVAALVGLGVEVHGCPPRERRRLRCPTWSKGSEIQPDISDIIQT
jgi:hypothetical protein